jgi:hypothetical protein
VGKERGRRETLALIRLHIVGEGPTEERFVKEVLGVHLGAHDIFADAHAVTTGRRYGRLFRGGLLNYEHLARDLTLWMKEDQNPESWFTTMIDLYHLPTNFPDRSMLPPELSARGRVVRLEAALKKDIAERLGICLLPTG